MLIPRASGRRKGRNPLIQPALDDPQEIDWGHPLAAGLVACYLPTQSTGWHNQSINLLDLTGLGRALPPFDSSGNLLPTPIGLGAWTQGNYINGVGWYAPIAAAQQATIGGSCFARTYFPPGASYAGYATIIGQSYSNNVTNSPYDSLSIVQDGNSSDVHFAFVVGSTRYIVTQTGLTSAGNVYNLGLTAVASSAAGSLRAFSNGTLIKSAAAANGTIGYSGTAQNILLGAPNQPWHSPLAVLIGAIWNRTLADGEMAWLNAEPYAMLRSIKRQFWFPVSTVGFLATLTDSVASSDTLSAIPGTGTSLTDSVASSDTFTAFVNLVGNLADTIVSSETLAVLSPPGFSDLSASFDIYTAYVPPLPPTLPIFPTIKTLGWSVHKKLIGSSRVTTGVTGRGTQVATAIYPRWAFTLKYGDDSWLREQTQNIVPYAPLAGKTEFEDLSAIFLACQGSYGEFYYSDPDDNSRSNQVVGTGDGVTTTFPLFYTWGTGPFSPSFTSPVGGIEIIDQVYFNGSPILSSLYVLDVTRTKLIFNSAPAVGVAITIDFYFYYRCRFLEDTFTFNQWAYNLWENKEVRFESVKL